MSKFFTTILLLLFIGLLAHVFVPSVQAGMGGIRPVAPGDCAMLNIPCGNATVVPLYIYALRIVNVVLLFVGILALIMLVWGGIRFITSRGNEQQTASAKNIILYAVIGLVVAGLSAVIVQYIIAAVRA